MDLINISGLSLSDRKYMSYGQEGMPVSLGSPIVQLTGGIFTTGGFSYSHLDAVPFHFTQDGKLMTDTELEVSGVVIGNVKVYSTDNTAPNAVYGKVGADQTLITQVSGTVPGLAAGSVIVTQGRDLIGSMYIPAGSVIVTQGRDLIGSMYVPAGSMIVTQGRDLIGSMYVPAGSVIVTQARDVIGSMYIPAGSVIITQIPKTEVYGSGGFLAIESGTWSITKTEVYNSGAILAVQSGASWAVSGLNYGYVIPSGTFYSTVACSGGVALPISGAVNQGTSPWAISGGVTISGNLYTSVIPSGTFILGSQTIYANVVQGTSPWAVSGILTIGSVSVEVDEITVISGNMFITSGNVTCSPSGTFYVTSAQSGNYYNTVSPSGTFYSTVASSGNLFTLGSQTIYTDVKNIVAISGTNYNYVIPSGTFILGSQTGYVDVSNVVAVSGLNYTQVIPSGTLYVTSAQSGTYYNTVSPSGTFYANIQAGSVIVTNTIPISGGVSILGGRTDNTAYLANGSTFVGIGGLYESSPTQVSGAFAGMVGMTSFRELKMAGYNTSTDAMSIEDISPALTQTINLTLLNAVGSTTGSNFSSTINCDNYREKVFYFSYSNGGTGSTMTVIYQASPDATNWFTIGSKAYTTTSALEYVADDDPHSYVKVYTDANNGGTLSCWLTARGG